MDSFEGVEKLRLGEVEAPRPGAGEVLLKLRFAALNPADAFLAQGMYPAKPALPYVLGRDGVGEVLALGPGVSNVRAGEMVGILRCDVGVTAQGTLAEQVVAPTASVTRVPAGWSLEETAAAPLVFLTAFQALTQWADHPAEPGATSPGAEAPRAGSVVVVTGASGGVGVATVQLGKSMGLTVVALSRSEEKRARLVALGADFVFDPADANLRKNVLKAIAPRQVDLAVDSVAGPLFSQVVAMMGYQGRVSVVGRSGGAVPEFNTATLFFKRIRVGGVHVGDYTPEAAQIAWREIVERLDKMGQRPVVDQVFPFEEVKAAFARLAASPVGKVLLRVAG